MTIEASMQTTSTPHPFPSIWVGLIWVIGFFAIQFIVAIPIVAIFAMVTHSLNDVSQNAETVGFMKALAVPLIWGMAASGIVTLSALALFLKYKGRAAAIGLNNWSKLPLIKTLVISAAVLTAAYLFNYLYGKYIIPGIDSQIDTTELINAVPKNPLNWVLLFLAISILPGITEELVFRGFLQNSLAHLMPAGFAIALSSGIFAAVHFQPAAFPALMSLGAAFGYIYHKTGSMRINIALHALNNGVSLLLSQFT